VPFALWRTALFADPSILILVQSGTIPFDTVRHLWNLIADHAGTTCAIRTAQPADLPASPPEPIARGWSFAVGGGAWYRVLGPHPLEIEGYPLEKASSEHQVLHLLGPITALVMAAAGNFPLHAAGLIRGPRGLALFAPSGAGKSTLASLALSHGWEVMGDDLLALAGDRTLVPLPGSLRVSPGSAPAGRSPLFDLADSRQWFPLPAPAGPPALMGLVRLRRGETATLARQTGVHRLATVAAAGLLTFLGDPPGDLRKEQLLEVAASIPTWELTVPEGLEPMRNAWPDINQLLDRVLSE
jgi:hypothetical protein